MTLKINNVEAADPKLEKYVSRLKEPARRAQQALKDVLEKSVKRFQDQAEKSTSDKEKYLFSRKTKRISNDLDVLKVLSEDDIVRYALLMLNKIISIASNPRIPRQERMKARVAAHKPLSTHLARLKQKLSNVQEETESESENEQDHSSSTLNIITFNNTVVLMRKDVRRAKVHIIHKLTRNIQKLRMAKGKEEKVVKYQRKADRLHKKVIHIKELHEDEISNFALSTTQNIRQLATDESIGVYLNKLYPEINSFHYYDPVQLWGSVNSWTKSEDKRLTEKIKAPTTSQALATIAINKFVAAHVRDFKTKYPDWQKIVPNFLKKKSKKRKLDIEKKDNEQTSGKLSQANVESDGSQSGGENDPSESEKEEESDYSENEAEEQSEVEEKSGDEEQSETEDKSEDESEVEDNTTSQDKVDEDVSDLNDDVSKAIENDIRNDKNTRVKNSNKIKISTDDSRVIQKIPEECSNKTANKRNSKTRDLKKNTSLSSPYVKAKPVKDKPKVIDPFFVTTTNEEYVTSQVPLSSENNLSSRNVEHFESIKSGSFINCDYKKKWEKTGSEGKYGKFNRFQGSAPYKKQSSGSFDKFSAEPKMDKLVFGNRKERRKALQQPHVVEKVEKLHPSWEAKKKQSTIIPFQGKKVTFD